MIERKIVHKAKIGVFAVAHGVYFTQFETLFESLSNYHADFVKKLYKNNVEVVDLGIVDSSEKAFEAANRFNSEEADIIFCNMITYATSSVFAPVIKNCSAPVVLTALQVLDGLDYSKANTLMQLENDNICSVPEFVGVANRLGKKVRDVIIGTLYGDDAADEQICDWCDVAKALHALRGARVGLMGHVMEAMYDMHADPTAVFSAFGVHVPLLELDDLIDEWSLVSEREIDEKISLIDREFDMPEPVSDPVTTRLTDDDKYAAAKTAAALDRFVEKHRLSGLAYYYEGRENSLHRLVSSTLIVGNSILNAQGIPMCGEYDIKTCIAMLIMDSLGIGGSFAEFHPFDFRGNFILVGHDGPHHLAVAEGKPVLRSLKKYHGKPGHGASVEFKLREGHITMLGITQTASGGFKLVVGEGESKKGPIPPTGNTNTRVFFEPNAKEFVKRWVMEGPTHHYALGLGHRAETIAKIADVLGIECVIVR